MLFWRIANGTPESLIEVVTDALTLTGAAKIEVGDGGIYAVTVLEGKYPVDTAPGIHRNPDQALDALEVFVPEKGSAADFAALLAILLKWNHYVYVLREDQRWVITTQHAL